MERRRVEIQEQTGLALRLLRRLPGGEQGGAHLVSTDHAGDLVLKLQPDPDKAARLVRTAPVLRQAVAAGWPAADWRYSGLLRDGTGFVLQEHVVGEPVEALHPHTLQAVLAANARQAGLGTAGATDDSAQLEAVVAGRHPWRAVVERRTRHGAALVGTADDALRRLGHTRLPVADVVHGDYSSSNMILDRDGAICFVDCETVGRGTRVRDLADLYRQCVVYPGAPPAVLRTLRDEACAVAGPAVFATCLIAVSYNNLAWWAEHRSPAQFDEACERLRSVVAGLGRAAAPG